MFVERIFPVLTPLAVDPGHPFPYISNLSLNLAVIVRDPVGGERRFARVKVPPVLPGLLGLPDGKRFVALEQVIAAHLGALFPGMEIESHHPFRVTRNADLTLEEEEADDLLEAVEMELRRRRFGRAVRLEVDASMTDEVRTLLTRELDLQPEDVYDVAGPLDLTALWVVYNLDRPELKEEPFVPVTPARLTRGDAEPLDVFAVDPPGRHPGPASRMRASAESVEEFIIQASRDPHVLAIKQTLYRTSGDSAIVRALIRAAEQGKQVAALVELKARGDEAANIGWARALEEAGVHVVYGLVGLKTHSKTALVVRQEGDGIRRYCHIGTGNYNSSTARMYEDIGILTASPELGADLTDLFNYLTGYSRRVEYRRLLVAPATLRPRMLELIEREAGLGDRGPHHLEAQQPGRPGHHRRPVRAPRGAGVQIDLIVRAICGLRPGVPGLSDNIRVRSIVGRWLEHSRIFYFGAGDTERRRRRVPGGLGRHDGTQPGPPGRGGRPGGGAGAAGPPPGDPRARSGRRHPGLGARCGRQLAQGADRGGHPGSARPAGPGRHPRPPAAGVRRSCTGPRRSERRTAGHQAIRRRRRGAVWCGPRAGRCGVGTRTRRRGGDPGAPAPLRRLEPARRGRWTRARPTSRRPCARSRRRRASRPASGPSCRRRPTWTAAASRSGFATGP